MKYAAKLPGLVLVLGLAGCTGTPTPGVSVIPASSAQCPGGGSVIQNFADLNSNGALDAGEPVTSSTVICNGTKGAQGSGAGLIVTPAPLTSCPAGGTLLTTFIDTNNNSVLDANEKTTSVSTVCNGTNGSNGQNGASAHITLTAATASQCPAGGTAYATYADGQTPVTTVVCNGVNGSNGQNGSNAVFEMGSIGAMVAGKSYTACHHDYIYIPGTPSARGWLIFRHQGNGANDQGIGSTGFQVWDVDIADFLLVSEVGGVTYCQLHWDPNAKTLQYTVVDPADGLNGTSAVISL